MGVVIVVLLIAIVVFTFKLKINKTENLIDVYIALFWCNISFQLERKKKK